MNNVIEQDHRVSKKRTWLAKGYKTFPSARRTLEGIETRHRIRKGRVRRVAKKRGGGRSNIRGEALRPCRLAERISSSHLFVPQLRQVKLRNKTV
ncbi:MAG: DDE-type integrase/transposase/recombinase [Acidobacteriaceae bacterium]|nr:DDE-type integrase/transposase/recombinase [Acidobacteriaceae bacterium]